MSPAWIMIIIVWMQPGPEVSAMTFQTEDGCLTMLNTLMPKVQGPAVGFCNKRPEV